MPVPRAARLASRKSVVPDPSLYANLSDDSDRDPSPPPPVRSTIKTTTTSSSKSQSKPPTTARIPSTTSNGKRKATSTSTESLDEQEGAPKSSKSSSRPLNDTHQLNEEEERPRSKQSSGKRKRVEKLSEEEVSDQQNEQEKVDRSNASVKPDKSKTAGKRPKANQETVEEEQEEGEGAPASSQAGSQRKGTFVPRAATSTSTRPNKPPPQLSTVLDGSDDDTEPFLFTTNPPTPHVAPPAKRTAAKPKQNPKGKAPRILNQEVDDDKTPDETRQPPLASTSRVKLTPTRPESNVAVTTHETPVQVKNIAFRQGAGTPATLGKTARRNSSGSARRGSSIGSGFTAMPHPEIDDGELWRSTDPLLPIAARTRSILSWATQRSRITVFEGAKSTPERDLAKSVVDSFIDDICNLVIDTSVPRDVKQRVNPAELLPHPRNVENAQKRLDLEEEFRIIEREQNTRQAIGSIYSDFSTRRTSAREASSSSTLAQPIDPVALAGTFDLSRPGPTSLEEALEMGRLLLEEAEAKQKGEGEVSKKKDRRKSKAKEAEGEEALDLRITETLEGTARLRQTTHRLSGFTRVASRYISHRSSEVHQALTAYSLHGLEATTASSGTNDPQAGGSSGSPSGVGLAGVSGVGASTISSGGLDPMDLLRAISRADSSRR